MAMNPLPLGKEKEVVLPLSVPGKLAFLVHVSVPGSYSKKSLTLAFLS